MLNRIHNTASSNDNDNNTGGWPNAAYNNNNTGGLPNAACNDNNTGGLPNAASNDNDDNTGWPNADPNAWPNLCKPRNQPFNLATSNFVLEQAWTIDSVLVRPHCHSANDRDDNLHAPRYAK